MIVDGYDQGYDPSLNQSNISGWGNQGSESADGSGNYWPQETAGKQGRTLEQHMRAPREFGSLPSASYQVS